MPEVRTEGRFVEVAKLDEVREAFVTAYRVAGRPVVLARTPDGIRAFDGMCTHARFQLATSRLVDGCRIECPFHGALFDAATGTVVKGPARRELEPLQVRVENGVVEILVDWIEPE